MVLQLTRERLPEALKAKVASYRWADHLGLSNLLMGTLPLTPRSSTCMPATLRAGYLADKRRELEQGLASGRLVAVVSTNALELGVDIGDLEVTLHVGVPSSMSSLRQQAGRAGRKGRSVPPHALEPGGWC